MSNPNEDALAAFREEWYREVGQRQAAQTGTTQPEKEPSSANPAGGESSGSALPPSQAETSPRVGKAALRNDSNMPAPPSPLLHTFDMSGLHKALREPVHIDVTYPHASVSPF